MAEVKQTLTQEIVSMLKDNAEENSEGYTGAEWIEAADLVSQLPKKIVLQIPYCAWDIELDEFGEAIKETRYNRFGTRKDLNEDGEVDPDWQAQPRREGRYDVLAILIWIPMKREEPDITLDDVKNLMHDMNIRKVTRAAFAFWGVQLMSVEEQIEAAREKAQEDSDVEGAEADKEEASDSGNFPE